LVVATVGEAIVREFSLTGFASFLGELANVAEAEHHALEHAAVMVETEAKRVIGTYEYGWPELADTTQAQRVAQGYSENEPGLRSGEMRESIEHTTLREEALVGSDDQNLVYFELGTAKQPPRSVLAEAAVHKEADVVDFLGRTMVAHLSSGSLPKPGG
jgi:hypothetical protein